MAEQDPQLSPAGQEVEVREAIIGSGVMGKAANFLAPIDQGVFASMEPTVSDPGPLPVAPQAQQTQGQGQGVAPSAEGDD